MKGRLPGSDNPVHVGWPIESSPFVAVVDRSVHELAQAENYLRKARSVYEVADRPTVAAAHDINALVSCTGASRIVSIGAGLVIDTAKLASYSRRCETGELLLHTAMPCGPEPYRAVAPFSMFEGTTGTREVVQEDWLRPNEVAIVPELLDELDPAVVQLFSGDSLVHVVESILTTLSTPESEKHAIAAGRVFVEQAGLSLPNTVQLALASIAAARAFDITKLGLAHALSRPLGIAAAISHDAYNLILGPMVIAYWGDDVIAESALSRISNIQPTAKAWADLVDGYRSRSGLPTFLSDAALTWRDAETAMAWAPKSSGIPNLPRPLLPDTLDRIVRAAWSE